MSYTVSLHHIVFSTYRRQSTLTPEIKDEITRYVGGIVRNNKGTLHNLNYMPDHVHLLIDLGAKVSLSQMVGSIKQSTSKWLKEGLRCPKFVKWAKEYYGVSLSPDRMETVGNYIDNQQVHHHNESFDREMDFLITQIGLVRYRDDFYE